MNHLALLVCERCDGVHALRENAPSAKAYCAHCHAHIYRPHPLRVDAMLSLTLTGLIAFAVANLFPVVSLEAHGQQRAATLLQAVFVAADRDAVTVAIICAVAAFALPLLELCLYSWILVALAAGVRPPLFAAAMHSLHAIRAWSMVEVFLLAIIISAVKLGGVARVTPETGVFAFAALTVILTGLRMFDLRDIWARAAELSR